jgi:hypothetical protein
MSNDPSARRAELYSLLGDLPDRDRPVAAETVAIEEREDYVLEKLVLDLNGLEPVPAFFLRPPGLTGRAPALLYNHWHAGQYDRGKIELLEGNFCMQSPPYALEMVRRGGCALAIDHWAFGERRGRTESEIFKHMLWCGQVMWGMMVFDSLRAADYLCTRPEVDPSRLATLGMSMGSTMAWWVAALDERVQVCVDICCLTDFQALLEARGLDGHGLYYFVPKLLNHFTTGEINALIAPRAHLSLAGIYDLLTPPAGLDRVEAELQQVYLAAGAPEAWKLARYPCGHVETAAMRAEILRWLDRWL